MKICIVSVQFLESTFPLAKYLSDNKLDITIVSVFPMVNRKSYVIDYTDFDVPHGFYNDLDKKVYNNKLQEYLQKINLQTFFYSDIKKRPILNLYLAFKLARFISKGKYDVIHLIGSSPFLYLLHKLLPRKKMVHTLHEVTTHQEGTAIPMHQRIILDVLCNKEHELIFHSETSKQRFVTYFQQTKGKTENINERVHFIPFGLFETYDFFADDTDIKEEPATILFFGRIHPYKGIDYLIDAHRTLQNKIPEIKLIIAGDGKLEYEKKPNDNIEIINKVLLNSEIIQLIKRSKVVVCPYTSASQSGIPMVVYLYGKPVIATDVGALPEVIEHMKTGIVVPSKDSDALADGILTLLENPELNKTFSENIQAKYSDSAHSWKQIALKTLDVYKLIN